MPIDPYETSYIVRVSDKSAPAREIWVVACMGATYQIREGKGEDTKSQIVPDDAWTLKMQIPLRNSEHEGSLCTLKIPSPRIYSKFPVFGYT